jgi:UDPglucose--hexose-1-phosphate uridylyltransferase
VPELREDPLTGGVVILAPGRAARPDTHARTGPPGARATTRDDCPFCAGHEAMTPPEVFRTGDGAPGTPGWRVRVVPNLYPLVGGDVDGAHEVVVLSPGHGASLGDLDDDAAAEVFAVLRDRAAHHLGRGLVHAQPFVNYGRAAGASIEHPHAQLIALRFVPPAVVGALARFEAAGVDLVALAIDESIDGEHGVLRGDASAWCPRASLSPWEVLIAHPDAGARFDAAPDTQLTSVAEVTRRVVAAYAELLGDVPYNVVMHTAPRGVTAGFHWYVRVAPRITVRAGFEEGTGVYVNTVAPEQAAAALREVVR